MESYLSEGTSTVVYIDNIWWEVTYMKGYTHYYVTLVLYMTNATKLRQEKLLEGHRHSNFSYYQSLNLELTFAEIQGKAQELRRKN